MALVDLWRSSPDQLRDKRVDQIISFAGDGKLKDGSQTCLEFRSYIDLISSSYLHRYALDCLENKFDKSGFVLQDIVNQAGRRLGFDVEDGRYLLAEVHAVPEILIKPVLSEHFTEITTCISQYLWLANDDVRNMGPGKYHAILISLLLAIDYSCY
jgi:hypothetical protein